MQSVFRKISVLILAIGLFAGCDKSTQEEIVHIPESAFLYALIANGVDKHGDGQISYPEAEATEVLLIPPSGITDLTGLEAFIQLDSLTITLNPLSGIDLSGNRALRYLQCISCELTSLDISKHTALTLIGVDNMPMLTEVCVWTLPFPSEGITVLQGFSPNINYITACNW